MSKKRKIDIDEIRVDLSLPEPASKKAKRLLKKGKALLPAKPEADSDDEAKTRGDGDADSSKMKERSPYAVWIGNLRYTVTQGDLRRWLVDNSGQSITNEHITRVHLPSSQPKASKKAGGREVFENRGFAYVDFTTYEATVAAIALSESEWHRRKLLIKDARSFEGRPARQDQPAAADGRAGAAGAAGPQTSTSRKVFVGNLSFQTSEADLRKLFSPCGEIESVKIAQFEDTGKCKGYAWVKFKDADAADRAVKGFVRTREIEALEEDFVGVDDGSVSQERGGEGEEEEEEGEEEEEEDEDEDEDEEEKEKEDKEEEEEEEDGDDGNRGGHDSQKKKAAAANKTKAPRGERKVKTRKWWVNTLHRRRLKIEHAEDDQTRYKKRFGKDAQKPADTRAEEGSNHQRQAQAEHPRHSHNGNRKGRHHGEQGGGGGGGERDATTKAAAEISNFGQDITVARLTGAAVKPTGKKTTLDT